MKKIYDTIVNNVRNNPDGMDSAKSLISDVAKVLKYTNNAKAAKVVTLFNNAVGIYSAGLVVTNTVNLIRTLVTEEKPLYTIEVNESDMLYSVITKLVHNTKNTDIYQPNVEVRSQTIESYDDSKRMLAIFKDDLIGDDIIRYESSKAFVYAVPNTDEPKEVKIGNHHVTIIFKKPDKMMLTAGYYDMGDGGGAAAVSGRSRSAKKSYSRKTAVLYCESEDARQEVMLYLRNNLSVLGKRKVTLFIGRSWGSFTANSDAPERDIESVVLKDNQLDEIIDELKMFIGHEEKYNSMGVPYHHGILLSGAPGTGKSSTAKAVASHLGLDTYYIPLSSIKDNETFNELVSEIKPRSVLLLEDIDTIKAAKDRDKKGRDGVTMDALLNVLDGVLSPHGIITIATTNYIEKLDEAVIRPGRIDTVYEIGHVDTNQFQRICKQFIGAEPHELPNITGIFLSPAEIIGEIKKHLMDKEAAIEAITLFVVNKLVEKDLNECERVSTEVS